MQTQLRRAVWVLREAWQILGSLAFTPISIACLHRRHGMPASVVPAPAVPAIPPPSSGGVPPVPPRPPGSPASSPPPVPALPPGGGPPTPALPAGPPPLPPGVCPQRLRRALPRTPRTPRAHFRRGRWSPRCLHARGCPIPSFLRRHPRHTDTARRGTGEREQPETRSNAGASMDSTRRSRRMRELPKVTDQQGQRFPTGPSEYSAEPRVLGAKPELLPPRGPC
jgi:hypothetical protein